MPKKIFILLFKNVSKLFLKEFVEMALITFSGRAFQYGVIRLIRNQWRGSQFLTICLTIACAEPQTAPRTALAGPVDSRAERFVVGLTQLTTFISLCIL